MPGWIMPPGMAWQQAMSVPLRTPLLRLIRSPIGQSSSHDKFTSLPLAVRLTPLFSSQQ